MKKYNITVNSKKYEVEVEEVVARQNVYTNIPIQKTSKQQIMKETPKAPKEQPASAKAVSKTKRQSDEDQLITAPMPGTIVDIKVSEGQSVKSGQILLILEAMKMENEIVSPKDGVISKIHTSKKTTVSSGDALITIE